MRKGSGFCTNTIVPHKVSDEIPLEYANSEERVGRSYPRSHRPYDRLDYISPRSFADPMESSFALPWCTAWEPTWWPACHYGPNVAMEIRHHESVTEESDDRKNCDFEVLF